VRCFPTSLSDQISPTTHRKALRKLIKVTQVDDLKALSCLVGTSIVKIHSRYMNRLGDPVNQRIFHTDDLYLETTSGEYGIYGAQEYIAEFGDEFGILTCTKVAFPEGSKSTNPKHEFFMVGQRVVGVQLITESLTFIEHGETSGNYTAIAGAVVTLEHGFMIVSKLSHNTEFIRVEFVDAFDINSWKSPRIRYDEDIHFQLVRTVNTTEI
jgi:hypothetical protein